MAPVSDSRAASVSANIQDVFLNHARREHVQVTVHLIDGRQLDARIKSFDRFAVIIEVNGADQLVFKHAIATIATQRPLGNYLPPQHP